jgi:serine/threonine protein kinase
MEKIGQGAFAEVKKVRLNNDYYAMKVYGRLRLRSKKFFVPDGNFADAEEMFLNEIEILKCLSHGNLVSCHEIMYGGNNAYLVMENCDLGQIMNWSTPKNNFVRNPTVIEYLSLKYQLNSIEDVTRVIFMQTALGIHYLHSNNISNRDVKVDNILCKRTNAKGQDIKIADFTTVRYSTDDVSYFTCGTTGFRSPEV